MGSNAELRTVNSIFLTTDKGFMLPDRNPARSEYEKSLIAELYPETLYAYAALSQAIGVKFNPRVRTHADQMAFKVGDRRDDIVDLIDINRSQELNPYVTFHGLPDSTVSFDLIYHSIQREGSTTPAFERTVDGQEVKRARVQSSGKQFEDAKKIREALDKYVYLLHVEDRTSVAGPTEGEPFVVLGRKDQQALLPNMSWKDYTRGDIMAVQFTPISQMYGRQSKDIHGALGYIVRPY
ncbi:MAG: hypothetical protein Q7S61_04140 [bacterium]|nr:hypothetical protein [bacterium]